MLFDGTVFNLREGVETKTASFERKQIIFSHGDRSECIFYIEKGLVKLTATSRHGKEAIIGLFGRGHFFGESCLNSEHPVRYHNAVALTDMRVRTIGRSAMIRLLRAGGQASYDFTRYMLNRCTRIEDELTNQLLSSSTERLARVFYLLALAQQESGVEPIAKLSQQTLAEMIGTTRQRVNVLIRHFRESALPLSASGAPPDSPAGLQPSAGGVAPARAKSASG
jgi:CRP/FNR family cyclic AMP-dependent transcriptional regulator